MKAKIPGCYQRWVKNIIGTGLGYPTRSCADPESFVRGGPTLHLRQRFFSFFFCWWGERDEDPNVTKSGLSSACRRNAIQILGRHWRLGGFVIFQGIRTSIAMKSYRFVILRVGGGGQDRWLPLWIRDIIDCASIEESYDLSYGVFPKWNFLFFKANCYRYLLIHWNPYNIILILKYHFTLFLT